MRKNDAQKIIEASFDHAFAINQIIWSDTPLSNVLIEALSLASKEIFSPQGSNTFSLSKLGEIHLPFQSFGNVSTSDLFNSSELSLFKIYSLVAQNYELGLDLGANIGLHTIAMARAGFKRIIAVEADETHGVAFKTNMTLNQITNVDLQNVAISDSSDGVRFTRLKGNLTGSHVQGSKSEVYGEVEEFYVKSAAVTDFLKANERTFIKMDIEGHEAIALGAIPKRSWECVDVCLEIGSVENAREIFNYCEDMGLTAYVEKLGWKAADSLADLPKSWKEGSLLLSKNEDYFQNLRD
jgi:FkbM family methyltransferase